MSNLNRSRILFVITLTSLTILVGLLTIIPSFAQTQTSVPQITISTDKQIYQYGDSFSITLQVSELTGDLMTLHLIDNSGKDLISSNLPITQFKTTIDSPNWFSKVSFKPGMYRIDAEYSGATSSVSFELMGPENPHTSSPASPSASIPQAANEIDIADGAGAGPSADCISTSICFSPNVLYVVPGITVTWKNTDTVSHTVTSGKITDDHTGSLFDSGLVKPGNNFQFTFATAGTYDYVCVVQPWMTGQVIVGSSVQPTQTPNPTTDQGSTPSLDELLKKRLADAKRLQVLLNGKNTESNTTQSTNRSNYQPPEPVKQPISPNLGVTDHDWIKYQVLDSSGESGQFLVIVTKVSGTQATFFDYANSLIGKDPVSTTVDIDHLGDFRYVIPITAKVGDSIQVGQTESLKIDGIKAIQVSGVNIQAFDTSLSETHPVSNGWIKIDMHNFYDTTTGMLLSISTNSTTNDGHHLNIGYYAIDASDDIVHPKDIVATQGNISQAIAAEVNVGINGTETKSIDNNVSVQTTQNTPDSLEAKVSDPDQTGHKVIMFNLPATTINVANLKDLGVIYDGKLIQPAPNMDAILHAKPTDNPSFAIVVTQSGVQVLVLVPHFSTHTITITNMSKVIPTVPEFPFTAIVLVIATFSIVMIPKIRYH